MNRTIADQAKAVRQRVEWIDVARGIGIVLVVYAHVLRGEIAAHLYPATPSAALQDSVIYAFHMPLFFFLSGLFATYGLTKGWRAFLVGRLSGIVYPYFLWTIVQTATSVAAGHLVNRPVGWDVLLAIGWQPVGQFWFLYALLVCQLLLLLPRWAFYLMVPIGIWARVEFGAGTMIVRSLGDLFYFAAGVAIAAPQLAAITELRWRRIALFVGGAMLFVPCYLIAARLGSEDGEGGVTLVSYLAHLIAAAAGIAGVIGIARLIAPWAGPLRALGAASMPIYLLHVIAAAPVRILLPRLHLGRAPVAMLIIVTLSGLLLPYIAYLAAQRLGWNPWLGFGGAPRFKARLGAPPAPIAGSP